MALPVWHVAGIGDFDGNGRSDILFVNDNGVFALWRTDPAGELSSAVSLGNLGAQWHMRPARAAAATSSGAMTGAVAEWLMNSAQVLSTQTLGTAPTSWGDQRSPFRFGVSERWFGRDVIDGAQ